MLQHQRTEPTYKETNEDAEILSQQPSLTKQNTGSSIDFVMLLVDN